MVTGANAYVPSPAVRVLASTWSPPTFLSTSCTVSPPMPGSAGLKTVPVTV